MSPKILLSRAKDRQDAKPANPASTQTTMSASRRAAARQAAQQCELEGVHASATKAATATLPTTSHIQITTEPLHVSSSPNPIPARTKIHRKICPRIRRAPRSLHRRIKINNDALRNCPGPPVRHSTSVQFISTHPSPKEEDGDTSHLKIYPPARAY